MITVHGQLRIKTLNGRYGRYNIGTLKSELGEFIVKEKELDEYEEGKYDGDFVISYIDLTNLKSYGRVEVGMRAYIESMTITAAASLTPEDKAQITPQEADPVIEEVNQTANQAVVTPKPVELVQTEINVVEPIKAQSTTVATVDEAADPDAILFGHLWPLGEVVKLDKTVDRMKLRQQRDRLDKGLGYKFNPLDQTWTKLEN